MADQKDTKDAPVEGAAEAYDARVLKLENERLKGRVAELEEQLKAYDELSKPKPKGAPKGELVALMHVVGKGRRSVKAGELLLPEEIEGLAEGVHFEKR